MPPLPSRLTPPRRSGSPVERPRLLQRLTSAADSPVFVLRAPAGYGKTTLLTQYAAAERRPVAWLALDERDDDPLVFLHDLAHALGTLGPMEEEILADLPQNPAAVVPVGMPRLLGWLGERNAAPVIVLDDVHHLLRADTRGALHVLCEAAPPGVTVVLAGRAKPPIALARLRAQGRLSELGAADLRLTPAEGTATLRAAGAEVDAAEGALVVKRTEGWPAAVYLVALMLRGDRGDRDTAAGSSLGPTEADLTEYFREEVLAGADPQSADFLVRSSILDDLLPALCDEVLEQDDSAARLEALADADLFVSPADAHAEHYRVHGLFREILERELARRPPAEARDLHRRASAAYDRRADPERAIRHALAAGDLERAAHLVWQASPEAISHGRAATVLRWRSWFSDEEVHAHPLVALAWGWAALELGDGETAAHAAAILVAADPRQRAIDGAPLALHGRVLRASVGEHGVAAAKADARAAVEGFPPDAALGSIPRYILGLHALLEEAPEAAAGLLREAEGLSAGVLPTLYVLALAQQALLACEAGDWGAAETLTGRATAYQRASGVEGNATQGIVGAVRALVEAHAGRAAPARAAAEQAVRGLVLQGAILRWQATQSRLVLARAWVLLGDGARARTLRREALAMLEHEPLPLLERWAGELEEAIARIGIGGEGPDLTIAELRTLQYLPTHLSLREIGERLYVTRNTVKTHTISIYRKLQVGSRSEAVGRARELGMLDG